MANTVFDLENTHKIFWKKQNKKNNKSFQQNFPKI